MKKKVLNEVVKPDTNCVALQRTQATPSMFLRLNLSENWPAKMPEIENAMVKAAPDNSP